MVDNTMDVLEWLRKQLEGDEHRSAAGDGADFAERLMAAEVDGLCGAGYGEVRRTG